jgi:hypothetical protein
VFCLTLKQPWATLLVLGIKKFETRSWQSTNYLGPLGITASKPFPHALRALCKNEPFASLLAAHNLKPDDLPRGCLLGTVTLEECIPTEDLVGHRNPGQPELSLGDFRPGRYAWRCTSPAPLAIPIPCKGKRGIWELDTDGLDIPEALRLSAGGTP